MSLFRSKHINTAIILLSALIMIVPFYFQINEINALATIIQTFVAIIASFTLGMGAFNLLIITYKQTKNKDKVAPFAIYSMVLMIVMIITGLIPPLMTNSYFVWLYNNLSFPTNSAMYAILCFYVASAAFRAFRARTAEAFVMLMAGFFIIAMNAPIFAVIWSGLPQIGTWINNYIVTGSSRAFTIAVAVGGMGISLRVLLGYDKTASGE
jgi:hypothetical protein